MHVGVGVGCLAILLLRMSTAEGATARQIVRIRREVALNGDKKDR